ncbi:MAG: hypothetical protein AAF222_06970 [Pseudomonadota bacterium]
MTLGLGVRESKPGIPDGLAPFTVVLMTGHNGSTTLRTGSGLLVDGLARSVISKVSATPHQRRLRRLHVGVKVLYAAVTDNAKFDPDQVEADLTGLRISKTDVVDHCIPKVAQALGEDWSSDRLSFAAVTSASAHLYGLCKSFGQSWDNIRPKMNARALLLATFGRESHIIGPAVLADHLRRRGHSVQLHPDATAVSLRDQLACDQFDALLVSVSTWRALETATKAIKTLKESETDVPILLGGAILNEDGFDVSVTAADVTTNDIDKALDAIKGADILLRVAE